MQNNYFFNIKSIFADKDDLTNEEFTKLWTKVLAEHLGFLHYYSILTTIIETNVSLERLADFKKKASAGFEVINQILSKHCALPLDRAAMLYWALLFHANGLNNVCSINPIVKEAMKMAGLPEFENNFAGDFYDFMMICLRGYQNND